MKKITTQDKTVYEYACEHLTVMENTNVNITPGVSIVYSYDVADEPKVTTRKAKK